MGTQTFIKYARNSTFDGKIVLNLGCGFSTYPAKNVVNLDAFDNCQPDVVHDLDSHRPLPFDDDYFDFIIANHILEHLKDWWYVFNECARVLKENGTMEIWVPGSGNDGIFGYRDHTNMINECSFFGTFETFRQGGNAWAEANSECMANSMKMKGMMVSLIDTWWMRMLPVSGRKWCGAHLRNIIIEQGYVFRKTTESEVLDQRRKFEEQKTSYHLTEVT